MVRWLCSVTLHLRRFRSRKGRAIASALFCTDPLYFGEIGTLDRSRTYTCPNLNRMSLPIGLREHIGGGTWCRTKIHRVKVCCLAVRLYPYNAWIYRHARLSDYPRPRFIYPRFIYPRFSRMSLLVAPL